MSNQYVMATVIDGEPSVYGAIYSSLEEARAEVIADLKECFGGEYADNLVSDWEPEYLDSSLHEQHKSWMLRICSDQLVNIRLVG